MGSPPAPVCDAKAYGAKGNGVTKDTVAIQRAIDACAGTGRTVSLKGGIFLSGMLRLKSQTHLRIEDKAVLKGTQDDSDYPDTHPKTDNSQLSNCRKSLLYAEGVKDLTLDGKGTIDGNGNAPQWMNTDGRNPPERTRPMAIYIVQSSHVTIRNLSVKNAAMWAVVNLETDDLLIQNLNIRTPFFGTRDGIDIVDCHRALVEGNTIFSEDDSICLKSGTARGVQDIVVRNNHILQSTVANGLKLGTASTGSFKNVLFENNVVENVDKAAMAVESVDGAVIQNIVFRKIQFHNAGTAFFVLLGKRGSPKRIGSIDGVAFEEIVGSGMKHSWGSALSGSVIDGATYSLRNLSFENVSVAFRGGRQDLIPGQPPEYQGQYPDPNLWGDLPASGLFLRHIDGIRFENAKFSLETEDKRNLIEQVDVDNFSQQ